MSEPWTDEEIDQWVLALHTAFNNPNATERPKTQREKATEVHEALHRSFGREAIGTSFAPAFNAIYVATDMGTFTDDEGIDPNLVQNPPGLLDNPNEIINSLREGLMIREPNRASLMDIYTDRYILPGHGQYLTDIRNRVRKLYPNRFARACFQYIAQNSTTEEFVARTRGLNALRLAVSRGIDITLSQGIRLVAAVDSIKL